MKLSYLAAGTSRFAHFAGLTRRGRRAAEDDQDDGEQKGKRSSRAEDDDDDDDHGDDDQPKGKKSRRAADEDDDDQGDDDQPKGKKSRRAVDEDDDQGDDDQPKGKKSRRAADDDDDEDVDDDKDEMNGRSARASARRREQARIATILGHPLAANNVELAISLACDTRMTRQEAIRVMRGQKTRRAVEDDDDFEAPRGNRHARTDRGSRNPQLGNEPTPITGKKAVEASWDSAFKKAGVATR